MKKIEEKSILVLIYCNGFAMTSQKNMFVVSDYPTYVVSKESSKKRKRFTYKKGNPEHLAFVGPIPFCSDMEAPMVNGSKTFRGNALINLISDRPVAEIRKFIDENLLWPVNDDTLARIVCIPLEKNSSNYEYTPDDLVYPELDTHCGPLQDIKSSV